MSTSAQNSDLIDNNYNSFLSQIEDFHWVSSEGGWNCLGGIDNKKYVLGENGLIGSYIQSPLIKGKDNILWSTTYEYLVYFDDEDDRFYSIQLDWKGKKLEFGYKLIEVDSNSNEIILKIEDSIYKYNYANKSTTQLVDNVKSVSFTKGKQLNQKYILGNPWLNGTGIEIFDENWNKTEITFDDCSIGDNVVVTDIVSTVYYDWLISEFKIIRLNKIDPCKSKIFVSPYNSAFSFAVNYSNQLVISTEGEGLIQFDLEKETFSKIDHLDLNSDRPVELFLDNDDFFWISYRNRDLDKFHISEIQMKELESNFGVVSYRFSQYNNRLFLANELNEKFELQFFDKSYFHFVSTPDIPSNFYIDNFYIFSNSSVESDSLEFPYNGNVSDVFQFNSKEIAYKVRATSLYVRNEEVDTLLNFNQLINDVSIISDTKYFISSNSGLLFNDIVLDSLEYIFDGDVHCSHLVGDVLYFSSKSGIHRYDLLDKKVERLYCSPAFIRGKSDLCVFGDYIFLVSDSFVTRYNLNEFENSPLSKLSIDFIKIDGKEIEVTPNLKLNFNEQFSLLPCVSGINSRPIEIYYQFDDKYLSLNLGDSIVLYDLAIGTHILRITGLNNSLNATSTKEFNITVLPPFHQTWWFRSLAILGLIGIGFFISYLRTRQKLKRQQILIDRQEALQSQRNRMSQDLHDEMGSGLSAIKHLSATQSSRDKDQQIESIATTLIRSMRDLLWSLDESNDTIHNLAVKIRQTANQMLRNSNINHKIAVSLFDNETSISGPIRRNLVLVTKELLNNALKHSQASILDITFTSESERMILQIRDNGIGYDISKAATGYGLKSIEKRLKDIGATSKVVSNESGTNVKIELPLL